MMDQKSWLWKKKPTEKSIVAADKLNLSQRRNEKSIVAADILNLSQRRNGEEILQSGKAESERDLKLLNEKLSSALSECNAKDEVVEKHAKMAQEALTGWEKAEAETMLLKQELDEVLLQRVAGEERITHLDMALKECMQQLRFVREEQELRIHDAMMKTSREFENTRIVLEEKLADTNKRLTKLGAENTQLGKSLLSKDKLIEEMNERKTQAEADFNALVTRLESTEKENASLRYEVRVLEKELEIRNEEREFNRRTADVAHKQHLESTKKIAKLESECQRLRILVRKRLPGPAAVAKMKNEVEMLGRDPAETRRSKSSTGLIDFAVDNSHDTPSKRINFLNEQLCVMEEENRSLRETLNKKTNELLLARIMDTRSASRVLELDEASKGRMAIEPETPIHIPHEFSLASMSDMGSDDKVSCAESWASSLVSDMEHFRNGKQMVTVTSSPKTVGASGIDLMDDFVEMEKLAIVSTGEPFGSSRLASVEGSEIVGPLHLQFAADSSAAAGRESIFVPDSGLELSLPNQDIQSANFSPGILPCWLQDILKVILEQTRVTQRKPDHILEDIKLALQYTNLANPVESADARGSLNSFQESNHSDISGHSFQIAPRKSPLMDSANGINGAFSSRKKSYQQIQSNLSKSISKMVELIEAICLPSPEYGALEIFPAKDGSYFPGKNAETPSGYTVRVFQWKTSELTVVLQQFIQTCNDFLTGKLDFEKLAEELSCALDWVVNHCFSLQDVSSMRDAIKKHFDLDESLCESEIEDGRSRQFSDADKLHTLKEQLSDFSIDSSWNGHKLDMEDELTNMGSADKDLEGGLQSEIDESEGLMIQLQASGKSTKSLQTELETSKESKGTGENQVENSRIVNKDHQQMTVSEMELNESCQRFSSLETEPEDKNNCLQEMEATRLDLQLRLGSVTKKETPTYDADQEEKQLRTDLEITAASEKLAECQETILNLGRQLKALASPRDASPFDKPASNPSDDITTISTPKKPTNQRSSLLDKMLAEDNAEAGDLMFPKIKEVICLASPKKSPTLPYGNTGLDFLPNGTIDPQERYIQINGIKQNDNKAEGSSFAIVTTKKKSGGGLLRKLLCRKEKVRLKK